MRGGGFGSFVSFVSGGCSYPRFSCTWWVLAGSALNTKNRLYIILYYTTHKHLREKGLRAKIHKKDRVLLFFQTHAPPTAKTDKTDKTLDADNAAFCVSAQPSPELLNRVGHSLLLAVAAGHSAPLQAAAGALDRLGRLLPDASPEGRLVAVLMSLTHDQPSPALPTDQSVDAVPPPPARARRQGRAGKTGKTDKTVRPSRKGKPASQPILDAGGRLQASKIIDGVGCVSQAEARKALELTCSQMLRLEDQRLLERVQETGLRHVWYPTQQVQRLLDLIDRGVADPKPDADDDDDDATDGVA